MTLKDTSYSTQQAEELERALEAQYRADREHPAPDSERESWKQIRRALKYGRVSRRVITAVIVCVLWIAGSAVQGGRALAGDAVVQPVWVFGHTGGVTAGACTKGPAGVGPGSVTIQSDGTVVTSGGVILKKVRFRVSMHALKLLYQRPAADNFLDMLPHSGVPKKAGCGFPPISYIRLCTLAGTKTVRRPGVYPLELSPYPQFTDLFALLTSTTGATMS